MISNILHHSQPYLNLLKHFGFKYKCPFCGFHSKELLPVGIDNEANHKYQIIGAGKRNAGCPKCGSIDRFRLVYSYLKYEAKIFNTPQKSILHFAPELLLAEKMQHVHFKEYVQADFFAEGQHCNYSNEVQCIDVQDIPYKSEYFDLILCNHVLEHVPDDKKAMCELYRILKKDGSAILQVPISPILNKTIEDPSIIDEEQRIKLFGQKDHIRLYGTDYTSRLNSCGFIVQQLKLAQKYPKFGLNPKKILFICKKDT